MTDAPRPLPLDAPDDLRDPKLRTAVEECQRSFRQWREAGAEVEALAAGRAEAIAQDRQAYADALAEGKADDPGEKFTREYDQRVHDARRRVEALGLVAERAWAQLEAAVAANRPKAQRVNAERTSKAWAQLAAAVEAVDAAVIEIRAAYVERNFIEDGPRSRAAKVGVLSRVPLDGRDGERYMTEAVIEALKTWSTRPAVEPLRTPPAETDQWAERRRALGAA